MIKRRSNMTQFLKDVKSEWHNIKFPKFNTAGKETAAIITVSAIVSVLIAGIDYAAQSGLDALFGMF